jgi:pimeloyl-ACP methyl ester carboxylesterase
MPKEQNEHSKLPDSGDPLVIAAVSASAVLGAVAAAIGGWIGYSALGVNHREALPPATMVERRTFISPTAGMISYYADRKAAGRPLVLIHSINAAASAYELMPIFEHYQGRRPVYALDLPGFGFSDRSNRVYSPRVYTNAILDFLQTQVRDIQDGGADVVALSLGSEFAASAAKERVDLFHSLTMISPSGFTDRRNMPVSPQAILDGRNALAYRLFAFPVWSQAFYDLLTTRPSINFFLKQSFEGPVDPGLVEYSYATAHQPGARYAPLYFVSGKLFTPNIRERVYEQLALPVLVIYDRDSFVRFDALPGMVERHPNWRAVRIAPTKGLPHFEKMSETAQALDDFWKASEAQNAPEKVETAS